MATLKSAPAVVGADLDTGEAVLNDVYDLIVGRLPRLPLDDPARPALAAMTPMLAQSLGRARVTLVVGGDA